MSATTNKGLGGLSAPARGRPRKNPAVSGVTIGIEKPEGGKPESDGGIEITDGSEPRTASGSRESAGPIPVDPLELPSDDGGSGPRRRGRPRAQKKEENRTLISLQIEELLMSGASMLASIANTPELEMDAERAKKIQDATIHLAKLYPIGMSEKTVAWTNFGFAVGGWLVPGTIAWWKHPAPRKEPLILRRAETPAPTPRAATPPSPVMDLPRVESSWKPPEEAKTPSEMWAQPGDILEPSEVAGED